MEKDLQTVKKDLETEVSNFKVTLDKMYKAMDAQEAIMIDFEKKYPEILRPQAKKAEDLYLQKDSENSENDSAKVFNVIVLPVPVAPAIKP